MRSHLHYLIWIAAGLLFGIRIYQARNKSLTDLRYKTALWLVLFVSAVMLAFGIYGLLGES